MNFMESIKSKFMKKVEKTEEPMTTEDFENGVSAIKEGNMEEAYHLFEKVIQQQPDNGKAYYYVGYSLLGSEQYGRAINAFNDAIKYLEGDEIWLAASFLLRAKAYEQVGNHDQMLSDLEETLRHNENSFKAYQMRIEYYYDKGMYDLAMADCDKWSELQPGNPFPVTMKGRCEQSQHNIERAKELYEYAIKLDEGFGYPYFCLAGLQLAKADFEAAIDNYIKALQLTRGQDSISEQNLVTLFPESCHELIVSKLMAKSREESNFSYWPHAIGLFYYYRKDYLKAATYFDEAFLRFGHHAELYMKAQCLYLAKRNLKALLALDKAIEMEPGSLDYIILRVRILLALEWYGQCENILEVALKKFPNCTDLYNYYAECLRFNGKLTEALEKAEMAMSIDPGNSLAYYIRGKILMYQGDKQRMAPDFEKALELRSDFQYHDTASLHCLLNLGRFEEARLELEKSHLENDQYYLDKAWYHAEVGEVDEARESLRKAIELGFTNFFEITSPYTPDSLISIDGVADIVSNAETQYMAMLGQDYFDETDTIDPEEGEVPFVVKNEGMVVRGEVNGLPLNFIFDTGASVISISSVEAAFMLKNDYLEESDLGGVRQFRLASGEFVDGTVVNLREVNLGGVVFKNVRASIQNNQEAPVLLGQSMLARMSSYNINRENNTISFVVNMIVYMPEYLCALMQKSYNEKDYEKAAKAGDIAIPCNDDQMTRACAIGVLQSCLVGGLIAQGKSYLEKYMQRWENDEELLVFKTGFSIYGHDWEEAIKNCDYLISRNDNAINWYQMKGWILKIQNKTDEAAAIFQQLLEQDPEDIYALNILGEIEESRGNLEKAREYWNRGKNLPENRINRVAMASILSNLGLKEDFLKYAEEISPELENPVDLSSGSLNCIDMAILMARNGEIEKARSLMYKSVEFSKHGILIYYQLEEGEILKSVPGYEELVEEIVGK